MRLFWNDLLEVIWPKKWVLCSRLGDETMLIISVHRTKADAVMSIEPGVADEVLSVDALADYAVQFRA